MQSDCGTKQMASDARSRRETRPQSRCLQVMGSRNRPSYIRMMLRHSRHSCRFTCHLVRRKQHESQHRPQLLRLEQQQLPAGVRCASAFCSLLDACGVLDMPVPSLKKRAVGGKEVKGT